MESARCKAFIESVERGSFRAAAEALGYTPSAVSQLVAALEKDLGLNLLIRTKKGVTVTSEGARLAPIVRSYLAREKEMYELASEMQGISVGNLTIAAYPSVATTWLPKIFSLFTCSYRERLLLSTQHLHTLPLRLLILLSLRSTWRNLLLYTRPSASS